MSRLYSPSRIASWPCSGPPRRTLPSPSPPWSHPRSARRKYPCSAPGPSWPGLPRPRSWCKPGGRRPPSAVCPTTPRQRQTVSRRRSASLRRPPGPAIGTSWTSTPPRRIVQFLWLCSPLCSRPRPPPKKMRTWRIQGPAGVLPCTRYRPAQVSPQCQPPPYFVVLSVRIFLMRSSAFLRASASTLA